MDYCDQQMGMIDGREGVLEWKAAYLEGLAGAQFLLPKSLILVTAFHWFMTPCRV